MLAMVHMQTIATTPMLRDATARLLPGAGITPVQQDALLAVAGVCALSARGVAIEPTSMLPVSSMATKLADNAQTPATAGEMAGGSEEVMTGVLLQKG